jgi:hypothetical protein
MPKLLTILDPQSDDREEIACSTASGLGRFNIAGGFLAVSVLCLICVQPRDKGTALSLAFFGASVLATVAAGLVTTIVFFPRVKRVKVTKAVFWWGLSFEEFSYDGVSFSVRNFSMGNRSATPPEYVATINGTDYVLNLPADFPATEERLPQVMARFGFENAPNKALLQGEG